MKRLLAMAVILILFVPLFPVFMPSAKAGGSETTIFQDDFESCAVGTFPSAGGWQIVWNGAGDQYQVITDSYSNSPTKSLQLMGSYGWSVVVKKDFSSSSNIIGYEAHMMASPGGGGSVAFCNIPIATWGRYYAMVGFGTDGYIWACEKNNEGTHQLQPFTPYTWYKIRVVVDRTARLFNVWIDDVLRGQNIPIYYNPYEILSLQFQVGWVRIKNYFDDVKVFEVSGTPPPTTVPVISTVSTITATNLQTIYIYGSGFGNTPPQTVSLGDGSVDTVNSSTTPSIAFDDSGKWGAGWIAIGVNCAIGIYLNSWSDNEIVLGGFGTALGTHGWNIVPGDLLDVKVFTATGEAHYETTVAGAPQQSGSITGVVFYFDSEGNMVTIPEATVSLTYTSYTTTTDAQGRYFLANIPFDRWMMSCNVPGYTERNEYATINSTYPYATVHFCMKAQIMDDLKSKAIDALNTIGDYLLAEANHVDDYKTQFTLSLLETACFNVMKVFFMGTLGEDKFPATVAAIAQKLIDKGLESYKLSASEIFNKYTLSDLYNTYFKDSLDAAKQQIEQYCRPIDSAILFKYPNPLDPSLKKYITDVSNHFDFLKTIAVWNLIGADFTINNMKKLSTMIQTISKTGLAMTIGNDFVKFSDVHLALGYASGSPIGQGLSMMAAGITITSLIYDTANFAEAYSQVLVPDFWRDLFATTGQVQNVASSLRESFTKAGKESGDPSVMLPSVQIQKGDNPSFSVENTGDKPLSSYVGYVVQLWVPELDGRTDVSSMYTFTSGEANVQLNVGGTHSININYLPGALQWDDNIRSKITAPVNLIIEVTAYADYGEATGTEYAAAKQTMTWSTHEYPANYNEFVLHSACDLHIYDRDGRHVGIDYTHGEPECEIPHSYYSIDDPQQIMILDPAGTYTIRLVGTGNGDYHLNVKSVFAGATTSDQWVNGTVANGQTLDYRLYVNASGVPIIDNSPPATQVFIGEPRYVDPVTNVTYVTQYTPFTLEASDNESGVSYTAYHIYNSTYDGGWQNYTTQFVLDPLKDGNYTIEFYSVDNAGNVEATNLTNVTLHWLSGDINHDGKVSLSDLVLIATAYGCCPSDPNWNQYADIAPPWGIISLTDLVTVAVHYSQTFHP